MRSLAVARAGNESTHETWSSGRDGRFVLLAGSYANDPKKWRDGADFHHHEKGLKYPWFYSYLKANPWVFDFDAVWLVDDDIVTDADTVSDMFQIFLESNLWAGQPTLYPAGPNSFPAFKSLVSQRGRLLRYFSYIEEQMPIFSGRVLRQIWETFSANHSGWGLRIMWKHILMAPMEKVAAIDATPMRHSRPARVGPMYTEVLASLKVDPFADQEAIAKKYGDKGKIAQTGVVMLDPKHKMTQVRMKRQEFS
jgi:hypothetical protein